MVRMFGKIAKFFKRSAGKQSEAAIPEASAGKPDSGPLGRPRFAAPGIDLPVSSGPSSSPSSPVPAFDNLGRGTSLALPFSAILQLVPKELHGKMAAGAGGLTYNLPKVVALEQLPRGAVKVAFGDLRRAAPPGLFASSSTHDTRMVDLPLREILNQLHPEAFARRPAQNRLRVPEEVTDLFGAKGERLTEVRVMKQSELKAAPAPTAQRSPAP